MEFTLFFDESGRFEEASFRAAESDIERRREFSQIAGLLIEGREPALDLAEKVLFSAFETAWITELPEIVHGKELFREDNKAYEHLISFVIDTIIDKKWQPVRIVNLEDIGFGSRAATYCHIVAALTVRVFEQLSRIYKGHRIILHLIGANYVHEFEGDDPNSPVLLDRPEYQRRVEEYMSFEAVRLGLTSGRKKWTLGSISLRSGRKNRWLQICDLLSHASYMKFRICNPELKEKMERTFGEFNFRLYYSEFQHAFTKALEERSAAAAIQLLIGEFEVQKPGGPNSLYSQIGTILQLLESLDSTSRNYQLLILDNWILQLIAIRENLRNLSEYLDFIQGKIIFPLMNRNDRWKSELAWFDFSLNIHGLSIANHLGALVRARDFSKKLDEGYPVLAGRWEHASMLVSGFVQQSVHYTDCFEFDEASKRMKSVDDYYAGLAGLFCVALPELFPENIRSTIRGKTLGTWLQCECMAGLRNPERLLNAQQLSDRAMVEFNSSEDRLRQLQYRCQIETCLNNFDDASRYLAESLKCPDSDYMSIANAIAEKDGFSAGFSLLHFMRLGAELCRQRKHADAKIFRNALKQSNLNLKDSEWIYNDRTTYPSHGIRRSLLVIFSSAGSGEERKMTQEYFGRLESLIVQSSKSPILKLIILSGCLESVLYSSGNLREILLKKIQSKNNTVRIILESLPGETAEYSGLNKLVTKIRAEWESAEKSEYKDIFRLLSLLREVGY